MADRDQIRTDSKQRLVIAQDVPAFADQPALPGNHFHTRIRDDWDFQDAHIDRFGRLWIAPPGTKLVDDNFNGTALSSKWAATSVGGMAQQVTKGHLELNSGLSVAAGASITVRTVLTVEAPAADILNWTAGVSFNQAVLANAEALWGLYDTVDGFFFWLDAGVLKVASSFDGVVTTASIDDEKPTDGFQHQYRMLVTTNRCDFFIDNKFLATLTSIGISPRARVAQSKLPFYLRVANTGSPSTALQLLVNAVSIRRLDGMTVSGTGTAGELDVNIVSSNAPETFVVTADTFLAQNSANINQMTFFNPADSTFEYHFRRLFPLSPTATALNLFWDILSFSGADASGGTVLASRALKSTNALDVLVVRQLPTSVPSPVFWFSLQQITGSSGAVTKIADPHLFGAIPSEQPPILRPGEGALLRSITSNPSASTKPMMFYSRISA